MAENIKNKISLWFAVLININAIVGGAFFLGVPALARIAGCYAPLAWLFGALLFIPITQILINFSRQYPFAGGLYTYAQRSLGVSAAKLCGIAYFVGTSAANGVILNLFCQSLFKFKLVNSIITENNTSLATLNLICLAIFAVVCMRGAQVLEWSQIIITIFKAIPFAVAIIAYFKQASWQTFVSLQPATTQWLITSTPTVIFAYLGIECSTSIAHIIKDSNKNTGRAIYLSFLIVAGLYATIQYLVMATLGVEALQANVFESLVLVATNHPGWISWGQFLVSFGILISYLGNSYSLFYANNWNLYAMSHDLSCEKRVNFFTRFNEYGEPYGAIFLQAMLIFVGLRSLNTHYLISVSDIGATIAYALVCFAFIKSPAFYNAWGKLMWITSLVSCSLIAYYAIDSLAMALATLAGLIGLQCYFKLWSSD